VFLSDDRFHDLCVYVHNNITVNVCARHIISIEGNFDGEQRGNGFGFQTILMIIKNTYNILSSMTVFMKHNIIRYRDLSVFRNIIIYVSR